MVGMAYCSQSIITYKDGESRLLGSEYNMTFLSTLEAGITSMLEVGTYNRTAALCVEMF